MELLGLARKTLDDRQYAHLMADWIEEHATHPERDTYMVALRGNKLSLTIATITEAVAKFGNKKERKFIRKIVKKALKGDNTRRYWGRKSTRKGWRQRRYFSPHPLMIAFDAFLSEYEQPKKA